MTVSNTELAALIAGLGGAATTPLPAVPARCQVTELLITDCAHCRYLTPQERTEYFSDYFPARYPGNCADCGAAFDIFDMIRDNGDGGFVAQCCGGPDQPTPAELLQTPAPHRWWLVDNKPEHPGCPQCVALRPSPTQAQPAVPQAPPTRPATVQAELPTTPVAVDVPPASTVAVMRDVFADLDASRPRSRQTTLGPSELGTPCQRQIAYKLAGVPRLLPDARPPWAPMQGTAMHGLAEEALHFHNRQLGRTRWVVEEELRIDDEVIGHGDAFDLDTAMVIDWKYVGVTTLRAVKRKTVPNAELVKPDYRVQGHLYGRGHERAGRTVRWVRLVFLARGHDYDASAEWTEAYDPAIADEALRRYRATKQLVATLPIATQPGLWAAVPSVPGDGCDWCPFRRPGGPADGTGCPGNTNNKIDKQVRGLIA